MSTARAPARSRAMPLKLGWPGLAARGVVVLAAGLWALWPLDRRPIEAPSIVVAAAAVASDAPVPLDVDAFRTPLWVAPPAPPQPAAAAPPPPPLKLQLIAILSEHGEYRAAVYDPDSDKLTVVGPGDTIAGRRIERVGKAGVALRDGATTRTLALRTEGSTP